MTRAHRSRCSSCAGLCLRWVSCGRASAGADSKGKVQLAVDGRAFTAHPDGPLVDTAGSRPGSTCRRDLGVRSGFDVAKLSACN